MITCKDVCDTASDYLDTPPGLLTRLSLRMHLLICKHCRRYLRQLAMSNRAARKLQPSYEPGDEEIDRLIERLKNASSPNN